ncbi:hypothetical protein N7474_005710 [Penicillium riverlandense]|uniref:uncharacterized protein n=1 Tax=Penicillium riverlandense TaxID=1903569 RepID=UPI00254957A5|nr:uncharacterized protein N7474_005710 [Penicillium riverlandense]KAJ5820119.1 hypothetical protein N7474_005710 [Penicillium riverlandense]
MIEAAVPGVIGAYGGRSFAIQALIVFCAGLSMYNAVELVILIFLTFTHYHGLYFWTLLISSLSLVPYALGFLFKLFDILPGNARWASLVLLTIGWYGMITGSSLVLWSRLHLIVSGEYGSKILTYTKWMIIVVALTFHPSTTVLTFGSNGSIDTAGFVRVYSIWEKLQMTGFFLQELILSSIYIVETIKILRISLQPITRKLMHQLVVINLVIIIMDVGLISMEYANLFLLETILKGVCYSIKLKLEFAILSRLVKFVGSSQGRSIDPNVNR